MRCPIQSFYPTTKQKRESSVRLQSRIEAVSDESDLHANYLSLGIYQLAQIWKTNPQDRRTLEMPRPKEPGVSKGRLSCVTIGCCNVRAYVHFRFTSGAA